MLSASWGRTSAVIASGIVNIISVEVDGSQVSLADLAVVLSSLVASLSAFQTRCSDCSHFCGRLLKRCVSTSGFCGKVHLSSPLF